MEHDEKFEDEVCGESPLWPCIRAARSSASTRRRLVYPSSWKCPFLILSKYMHFGLLATGRHPHTITQCP